MGNMYKETVTRRRATILFFMLILLVGALFLTEVVKNIKLNNYSLNDVTSISLISLIILASFIQLVKCKVRYTYFIIADQFIIHKINGSSDKVVENIKLSDIEYFGKIGKVKSKFIMNRLKNYTCSIVNVDVYCCIYREGTKIKKFYFEPSRNLITKLSHLYNKNKRLAS